jgi:hypothetical protein
MSCHPTLELKYMKSFGRGKWPRYPYNIKEVTHPSGAIWSSSRYSLSGHASTIVLCPFDSSPVITPRFPHADASRCAQILSPPHRVFGLGFVVQPRDPMVLWVNNSKPYRLGATSTASSFWLGHQGHPDLVLFLWSKPTKPAWRLLDATLHQLHIHDYVLIFLPPSHTFEVWLHRDSTRPLQQVFICVHSRTS